jgi:hypothetical protein
VSASAYGFVAYPFKTQQEGWVKTYLAPLGFVVNIAGNTQAPGTGVQNPLISGEEPALSSSKTKDFGLRYSIPGGKAYVTLSKYKTTQKDIGSGFGNASQIANIWTNLGYTDPALTTTTAGSGFAYTDPSARRLEGWEAELTANPTPSITLALNYSHPLSYIVSESEARKAYFAANRAEWEAGANAAPGTVINGRTILDPTIIRNSINQIEDSLNGLTTGTLANNTVNHRVNITGAYSFREGKLRGLRVNAGVQYRGHGKNGSRDARLKFGLPDNVNPTTAQNTEAAYDYLWTPPNWKHTLTLGANYTKRFGKYTYRFQMNVTNLLDTQDLIWGRSGPVGNGASAYTTIPTNALFAGNARQQILFSFVNPDPRKITLTTTVSF